MGNPVSCPTEQLLLNHDFSGGPGWTFTGPGWAIVDGQLVFTAVNDDDTCHQNWPYTNYQWQRSTMYISRRDIDGWAFFDQPIDHLGLYVKIYQTNEPLFPTNYMWTGSLGNPGDKMIFDWFSQVDLAQYLLCKYSLFTLEGTKFDMYALDGERFMFIWGNTKENSMNRIIYNPAEDDFEY